MALVYALGGHTFVVNETAEEVLEATRGDRPTAVRLTFSDGRTCVIRESHIVAVHDIKES